MIILMVAAILAAGIAYLISQYAKLTIVNALCIACATGVLTFSTLYFMPLSNKNKDKNLIIVGTNADFPPFAFVKHGKIVGFDIDIIEEISKKINKKIELKNMSFGVLLPSLQLGTIHVIAAGLTSTPERAKRVLFTTPYLDDGPLVIVSLKSNPIYSIQDLQKNEVVVNEGYTADQYISKIPGLAIRRLKSPAEAFLAVKSGRSAAFITAATTVKPFFDQYGEQMFNVAEIPGTGENSCIAVAPQYPELLKEIQAALDTMHQDGSLSALRAKWGL